MRRNGIGLLLGVLLTGLGIFAPSSSARAAGVDLKEVKCIAVPAPASPGPDYNSLGKRLAQMLQEAYGLKIPVVAGEPPAGQPAILLGRALATSSGLVSDQELDAVKHDGYVIRGKDNRIAAAGYRPLADTYAVYALLERLGVKVFPWHNNSEPVKVIKPLKDGLVPAFSAASKPFFDWRSVADHLDLGVWGGSRGDTGDPRSAANPEILGAKRKPGYSKYPITDDNDWVDGQHTAGYLVPRDLFYEKHPEYYAMYSGKRTPPTAYTRMALCLSNPDVHQIAVQRALEWIGLQPDRQFFWVMDADTSMCTCPQCLASDYIPNYYADRLLSWVNDVAGAVKAKYPDKVIFTAAYANGAKPPSHNKPESNVRVICAPWFWNARSGPSQPFASPRNVTAMEELMGWNRVAPGQTGLYSYPYGPYLWLGALTENLKLCAKHNIRYQYFCGRAVVFPEYFHYMIARLLWDPTLDTQKVAEEFCRAFYGPAATPMLKYFALDERAAERNPLIYDDPEYAKYAAGLLHQAETLAGTNKDALCRTQDNLRGWLASCLPDTAPGPKRLVSQKQYGIFRSRLEWYLRLNHQMQASWQERKITWSAQGCDRAPVTLLNSCGLKLDPPAPPQKAYLDQELLARADAYFAPYVKEVESAQAPANRYASTRFDAEAVKGWDLDASQSGLAAPPAFVTIRLPDGENLSGGQVLLPLSQLKKVSLPMRAEGLNQVHGGRFLLKAKLPQPLDASGCRYIELRIHTNGDVPATFYLDFRGSIQRVDFQLHAGEQILRVDLQNFRALDRAKWDGKLNGLMVDFWPQDNFYPHPPTGDVRVILAGVAARSLLPKPADLPHRGKAVWLTQYRPNIPFDHAVSEADQRVTRQVGSATERGRYPGGEGFRTFTDERALSPIFAIVTEPGAAAVEKEAAAALQGYLRRMYGVTLPINPPGLAAGPRSGNVILLGRKAALASERVSEGELSYTGPEGYVLRAYQGSVVIAGQSAAGTAYGVARYLGDHGVHFSVPGARERVPASKEGYLHELYLLDHPFFANRALPGGWRLGCQTAAKASSRTAGRQQVDVEALAEAVKRCAHEGKPAPQALLAKAASSPKARYVVAGLLWDPFADTSRLVREYEEGSGAAAR